MRRLCLALFCLIGAAPLGAQTPATPDLPRLLDGDASGFARAIDPREFVFPRDHGAHPDYRSEWWYYTGNLRTRTGRRFGYQLTIFRLALRPQAPPRRSAWAANQVYMAHFALTDVSADRFHAHERFARGALGLAGAQGQPVRVWLEDWNISLDGTVWRLRAAHGDLGLDLALTPKKPIVLQGERGLSRKSAEHGNASYYYSITRLETQGTVTVAGERHAVSGLSWMDREWSTSALAPDQAGWDWFALQLSNGYDLMYYRLRRRDGSIDPFSAGSLVDPAGKLARLSAKEVQVEAVETWRSPQGIRYPTRWRVRVPQHQLDLDVRAAIPQQTLDLTVRYWEGAVDVRGRNADRAVEGSGYLEMTGYDSR